LYIPLSGQGHPLLSRFYSIKQDHAIELGWTIKAGSTCDGIQIYRSHDNVIFDQIGVIAGICGSEFESQHYDFTDVDPLLNGLNYYRLELGGFGFTDTLEVECVDLGNAGYQVRPHPASGNTRILFANPQNESHTLEVFHPGGGQVFSMQTKEDRFAFDARRLAPGFYLFAIHDPAMRLVTSGPLLVLH
jgi:hypothetical protein